MAIAVAALAAELAVLLDGIWRSVAYVLVLGVAGSFVANALFIGYLVVAARWGVNLNDAAAAVASPHHKGFVRLRFAPDGLLEVIPFVVERTDRDDHGLLAACERRVCYRLDPRRRLHGKGGAEPAMSMPVAPPPDPTASVD